MPIDPICGMTVKESSPLRYTFEGTTYFFCGEYCLQKFMRAKGITGQDQACCHHARGNPWYLNKSIIVFVILLSGVLFSYVMPQLIPFRKSLVSYFSMIWLAVLAGLLLGGCIDYYIPREYISHILAQPRKRTIFQAVLLGFIMSACSHGILALSIQLHKKGASNPAVIAFLLASPWANITITIMLVSFFGVKALFIILSAILIALVTGLLYQILDRLSWIEHNMNIVSTAKDFSIIADIQKRARDYRFSLQNLSTDMRGVIAGAVSLSNMVLWWILIGMGIAAIAGAYIPTHFFHRYMGPSVYGLLVTLLLATLIEICSEGSAPMAFELFRQTGALGNSFTFLMAGVITDYTELGLLWHNVGKRTAIWLPVITIPQVLLLAYIANKLW